MVGTQINHNKRVLILDADWETWSFFISEDPATSIFLAKNPSSIQKDKSRNLNHILLVIDHSSPLPFRNESFDIVILGDTNNKSTKLNSLSQQRKFLQNVSSILRNKGQIIAEVKNPLFVLFDNLKSGKIRLGLYTILSEYWLFGRLLTAYTKLLQSMGYSNIKHAFNTGDRYFISSSSIDSFSAIKFYYHNFNIPSGKIQKLLRALMIKTHAYKYLFRGYVFWAERR